MPRINTVRFMGNAPDEFDGYVFSEYEDAWIPEDQAVSTTEDGYVHVENALLCDRCNDAVCHENERNEHMRYIHDIEEWWCVSCAEDHAYLHSDDNWYSYEEEDRLPDYHSQERRIHDTSSEHPFLIGFEVEKEDASVRIEMESDPSLPRGWLVERDGSLNDSTGFELVSPAYNLNDRDRFYKDVDKLKWALDADYSTKCGGHISISDCRYSTEELHDRIRPMFPLLLALYPKRLTSGYSNAIKSKDIPIKKDKYNAFYITENRIELRIVSAVKSAENLKWRYDLISHFLLESYHKPLTWTWMRKNLKRDGFVRQMLEKIYATPLDPKNGKAKVREVLRLYTAFAGWYYRDKDNPDISHFLRNYVEPHRPLDVGTIAWHRSRMTCIRITGYPNEYDYAGEYLDGTRADTFSRSHVIAATAEQIELSNRWPRRPTYGQPVTVINEGVVDHNNNPVPVGTTIEISSTREWPEAWVRVGAGVSFSINASDIRPATPEEFVAYNNTHYPAAAAPAPDLEVAPEPGPAPSGIIEYSSPRQVARVEPDDHWIAGRTQLQAMTVQMQNRILGSVSWYGEQQQTQQQEQQQDVPTDR